MSQHGTENEALSLFVNNLRDAFEDSKLDTDEKRKEFVLNVVSHEYPVFSQRICLRTFLSALFDLLVELEKGEIIISNILSRYRNLVGEEPSDAETLHSDSEDSRDENDEYEYNSFCVADDDDDSEFISFRG
jgi:hypothetical protein